MIRGFGLYNGYGMMGGGLGAWIVGILWLIAIVAIVVLVVWIARRSTGHDHMQHTQAPGTPPAAFNAPPSASHDEAVAIARKRFASGEISKEQFDEMMKSLG